MIDDIKNYLNEIPENTRLNYLREYLQLIILKIISDSGLIKNITFTGGTALRIIYKINRFSEDMDFSLTDKKGYSLDKLLKVLKPQLDKYNLDFEFNKIKKETVNSFFIRFSNLLFPLDLSPHEHQKLSIKVDIDTNPPKGGDISEYIYYDRFYFTVNHFSPESLFALKLHALLFRVYIKGRDYYDLIFFLNRKTIPKFKLFQNAAKQTHPDLHFKNFKELLDKLGDKLKKMDENKIIMDLRPFLLKPEEFDMINKKNILLFFKQYREAVLV